MTRRARLVATCGWGIVGFGLPGLAIAQALPANPAASSGPSAPAQSAALAPNAGVTVGEIIVTAQKRSENIEKVPETVTAISGANLINRGVTSLLGVEAFTPGADFNEEASAAQIFIRGIGQTSDFDTNDPAIAVNTNQVYTPRFVLASSLFDVSSVEVLYGPQGTLYGRNAAGGAVNITTNTPGRVFGGNALVEGGNYNSIHVFGAVDLPVTDDFALRLAFDENHHDGYITNGANDQNSTALRLTGSWKPTSRFSVLFHAEFEENFGKGNGIVLYPYVDPKNPWYQPHFNGLQQDDKSYNYAINAAFQYVISEKYNISLTYIPAFYDYMFRHRDPIGDPVNFYPNPGVAGHPLTGFAGVLDVFSDREEQVTNELRLNGDTHAFKWVAGFFQYYSHTQSPYFAFDVLNPGAFSGGPIQPYAFSTSAGDTALGFTDNSYAIYGQGTYSLTDRLRLTVGGRYTTDEKHAEGQIQEAVPIAGLLLPNQPFNLSLDRNHADYKVGMEADLARNSLAYFNIQTGFISGGINILSNQPSDTFAPETLTAYSAGVKNTFFGRRLHVNDEFFYYDYHNLQVSAIDLQTGASELVNVPSSRIFGDQLDGDLRLLENTTLSGNVVYLNTRIQRAILPPATTYACTPGENINPSFCEGTASNVNYAGNSLPNAPTWSASLTLTQIFPLGDLGRLQGQVGTHFESSSWGDYSHLAGLLRPSYTKTDLSLTYLPARADWTVAVWVKNVEDTAHLSTPGTTSVYGLNAWYIEPPRTFGGRVTYKF